MIAIRSTALDPIHEKRNLENNTCKTELLWSMQKNLASIDQVEKSYLPLLTAKTTKETTAFSQKKAVAQFVYYLTLQSANTPDNWQKINAKIDQFFALPKQHALQKSNLASTAD